VANPRSLLPGSILHAYEARQRFLCLAPTRRSDLRDADPRSKEKQIADLEFDIDSTAQRIPGTGT